MHGVSQSSVSSDRFNIMRSMLEKYQQNSLIRFWLGPTLFIFVNDPKLIEQVLSSPKCLEKSFLYKFLRLDKGLLVAKRKFGFRLLDKFLNLFKFQRNTGSFIARTSTFRFNKTSSKASCEFLLKARI